MPAAVSLPEGLPVLLQAATRSLPARGIGVVQRDDAEHTSLTYADAFGVTAYRYPTDSLPQSLRPPIAGPLRVESAELAAHPDAPLQSRLLLTRLPEQIRREHAVGDVLALPLPQRAAPALLLVGLAAGEPPVASHLETLASLAAPAADLLERKESAEAELQRLRRLEAIELVLPELFHALDVRWVFDRLSALTSVVLPHDILGLYNADLSELTVYAHPSEHGMPDIASTRYPVTLVEPWLYHVIDDLRGHPFERELSLTRAGGRSSLRVPLRLGDDMLGALNFTSLSPVRYTGADLAVARRIGDYVALALSHQRLAEEARRSEELRARAATSELLDELLASVPDAGELRDVFERVAGIGKKVLRHDALTLAVVLPGRHQCRIYASSGTTFPEIVDIPESVVGKVESGIVDDQLADEIQRELPSAKHGFRSSLRVAISFEGRVDSALQFLSYAPGVYKPSDMPVARRIADRLALALSRERREQALVRADEAVARAERLESRVQALTEELNARAGFRRVIGQSASWHQVLTQATQVAPTESTVLLLGESGTGKEVVARFVHGGSRRSGGPFVALNCAALPEQLLEAELFGYERGAFTGATQSKPGQLEQASGGTLFLDEVGEMSPAAQAKFLRVLQEREFQRLGGTRVLKTDARVVAATNRDLAKAMERGQFREDLYYRLNVFSIQLPPLRDRKDDVLPLSDAFLSELGKMLGRPPGGVSKEARQALMEYHWPGNVRELRNVLERAAILADGGLIAAEHLALRPAAGAVKPVATTPAATEDLKTAEKAMIEKALQESQSNRSKAARRLGITRAQLYVRMRRHGLE